MKTDVINLPIGMDTVTLFEKTMGKSAMIPSSMPERILSYYIWARYFVKVQFDSPIDSTRSLEWIKNNLTGKYEIYYGLWLEKEQDAILMKLSF